MSNSIAALHVAKKQLGLDDETYRSKLARITGKSSAKDMSESERQAVLSVFLNEGFQPRSADNHAGSRKKLTGPFAPKLQALWIAAWNLGIVANRDDKALLAFVKRQTGIDHTRFLYYADDAAKAIEALKAWMAREAGVDWRVHRAMPLWRQAEGYKVAVAQWATLQQGPNDFWTVVPLLSESDPGVRDLTRAEWIKVMNTLGQRVRKMKADTR